MVNGGVLIFFYGHHEYTLEVKVIEQKQKRFWNQWTKELKLENTENWIIQRIWNKNSQISEVKNPYLSIYHPSIIRVLEYSQSIRVPLQAKIIELAKILQVHITSPDSN